MKNRRGAVVSIGIESFSKMATAAAATPVSNLPAENGDQQNKEMEEYKEDINLREMFYQGVTKFGAVRCGHKLSSSLVIKKMFF